MKRHSTVKFLTIENKQYDVKEIINCLVDNSEFEEYKALHGKTIVCGYARIDGWAVGIVANQRKLVKNQNWRNAFWWSYLFRFCR